MTDHPTAKLPAARRVPAARRAPFAILGSPRRTIAFGIILLALLGYVDVSAGPNLKLTCFYLIPAFLLTWFMGRRWGYAVALVYAIVSLAADVHGAAFSPLVFWNAAVRLATFSAVTVVVDLCRNLTREIEILVEARTTGLQREISIRKESEAAIHRLASELSAAEDAQRRRLGHDLHDTLSQNLTVLKLQIEDTLNEIPAGSAARPRMEGTLSLLETLIQQTRTLTFELYPSMLDDLGLAATLRRYAEQLESQTTARISISETDTAPALSSPIRVFLFRATKELITNALKHGKAVEIMIHLRWRADSLRIVVDDDGTGFDPAKALNAADRTGLGLAAIAERLCYFGGTLRIESASQQGSRAILDLPLGNGAAAEK